MRGVSGEGFHNVDATLNPGARVSYLDAVTALEITRGYKRQTFAMMDIRPGDAVVDVGCGAGDDLRELATLVAPGGRVVGVDSSQTMLDQARVRTHGLPVECHFGDAHRLDFADNTFDACRCDRVLQHLERPEQALTEIVRITRPNGRVVLMDPDWETVAIDSDDDLLTSRIRSVMCHRHRNATMGRQLFGMAQRVGLTDVSVTGIPGVFTDWNQATLLGFVEAADEAVKAGAATEDEVAAWLRDLADRAAAGRFLASFMGFMVAGRKPPV